MAQRSPSEYQRTNPAVSFGGCGDMPSASSVGIQSPHTLGRVIDGFDLDSPPTGRISDSSRRCQMSKDVGGPMRLANYLLALPLVFLLSCTSAQERPASSIASAASSKDIEMLASAFRAALKDAYRNALPFEVAFLEVGKEQDPPEALYSRLSNARVQLLPFSFAEKHPRTELPWPDYVWCKKGDVNCKKRGIVIHVSMGQYKDANTREVSWSWDCAEMGYAGVSGIIRKTKRKWVFEQTGCRLVV